MLRASILEKNKYWFNLYRTTDGYNVYGGRSSLKYKDDQSNYEVLQQELVVLDAMAANVDRRIWSLARGEQPGPDEPLAGPDPRGDQSPRAPRRTADTSSSAARRRSRR